MFIFLMKIHLGRSGIFREAVQDTHCGNRMVYKVELDNGEVPLP